MGIRGFGIGKVPIEFSEDIAPEGNLLENSDLDVFPCQVSEPWELCTFNPEIPPLERLKSFVKSHGSTLFQPFDKEGLRVSPLKLKTHPSASFRMQPTLSIHSGWSFKAPKDHVGSIFILVSYNFRLIV